MRAPLAVAMAVALAALTLGTGTGDLTTPRLSGRIQAAGSGQPSDGSRDLDGEGTARRLCVTCHRFAPPDVLPRGMWRDEVARMHLIMTNQAGHPGTSHTSVTPALPPEMEAIARYYESSAPDRLPRPSSWPAPDGRLRFRRKTARLQDSPGIPAIAHVRLLNSSDDDRLEVVATDMRHGTLLSGRPYDATPRLLEIARTPHPSHLEPTDFDGDGVTDFLVADLGDFLPSDHERGAVVWLRGRRDGTYVPLSLDGWPRVSDVRAADFDGDGRQDLLVAAFGWRRTGHFSILKNDTTDYDRPSFVPLKVDVRTGAIHVEPLDLNADGRTDFIVLFAQEHETVTAFINNGPGSPLEARTIYAAPHPNWGSSGIEVVDLDRDGDADVLLTNGDTMDDEVVKPYHGIQWLENRGTYPFTEHRLADMPGVHRAEAADLDGDGDLDIVAAALLSAPEAETRQLPSVAWLEQVRRGEFVRHTLQMGQPYHATLDAGDFDRDGDVDFVVGQFRFSGEAEGEIEIWESLGKGSLR